MELVCVYCLSYPKEESPDNDNRMTIMDGKLICIDHIPQLIEEHRRRYTFRR